jgi:hypothetical protein
MRGSLDKDPTPIVDFALSFAKIEESYSTQTQQGTLGGALSYADSIATGA